MGQTPQKVEVVRGHHDGGAGRVELSEDVQDPFGVVLVEIAGRFVGEHDVGFARDGPRDRSPLLLPTRQFMGARMRPRRKSGAFEHLVDASAQEAAAETAHSKREGDVFPDAAVGEEPEVLEDNADVAPKLLHARKRDASGIVDAIAGKCHHHATAAPVVRAFLHVDVLEESGLSGAGRAGEEHELPGVDPERDVLDARPGAFVGVRDMQELDHVPKVHRQVFFLTTVNFQERHRALARNAFVGISLLCGLWSAFFASRSWEEVHWIGWLLAIAWGASALVPPLVRLAGDAPPTHPAAAFRWLVSVAAQNSSQEVLFFVLPFWIRSTTFTSSNAAFTLLLLATAAATLFDPLYLGRIVALQRRNALFRALVLFAGLDFLLPAITARSTVECAILAGAWSGASAGFGLARRSARGLLWGGIAGLLLAWTAHDAIAPVPLHLRHPVLCSGVLDHAPVDTLSEVSRGSEPSFWTPVFAPPGRTDSVIHEWHRDGRVVATVRLPLSGGREKGFRTWSTSRCVATRPGAALVEVRLADGQLLGRRRFSVVETKRRGD